MNNSNQPRHAAAKRAPRITFTLEEYREMDDSMQGACISCGAIRDCCEPDAREYDCDECGQSSVYGAQELLLMGRVK